MKLVRVLLIGSLLVLAVAVVAWLAEAPPAQTRGSAATNTPPQPAGPVLRIGLVPERDIFKLGERFQPLAAYLSERLGRPVELVTVNTYQAILQDFDERKIDGAFLGSLVAALAMDRLGAQVLAKPELPGGVSTYRGVVFVKADSPVASIDQLAGHSIAMVRTTTAGDLYPYCLMVQHGLLGRPDAPRIVWVGTHDNVALEVMAGRVDVGAIKDERLDVLAARHPEWQIRRLAVSKGVPNNALVVRSDVARELGPRLTELLLGMQQDPKGRQVLSAFGAVRFLPCGPEEYQAIYEMVEQLGPAWDRIGIEGPPPRPAAASSRATGG